MAVPLQMVEDKRKSEIAKSCSKLEPPITRGLVVPPMETSFNFIPFEKSLEGVQESHTCSIKDSINAVSLKTSANKTLITMKANNIV